MKVTDYKEKGVGMNKTVKAANQVLWSVTGVVIVLTMLVVGAYLLLHHSPVPHCNGVPAEVIYRNVTTWDNSYDPAVVSERARVPALLVCSDGRMVQP